MEKIWSSPNTISHTLFHSVNNSIEEFVREYHSHLPVLHEGKTLLCFSDYSGEEQNAKHYVYSFLLVNETEMKIWNENRVALRGKYLPDGRRISYKNYRDKLTQNFINQYLDLVDELPGFLITVSISKDIDSIFGKNIDEVIADSKFSALSDWTKSTREKALRIMHMLGFFVSGFSSELQNVIWITDDDSIAANHDRLKQLTESFGAIIGMYTKHGLGHLRVGTTQTDDGTRWIEDLCAIPDLVAGAYSEQLNKVGDVFIENADDVFWISSPDYQKKTYKISWWLGTSNKKLCKLCFRISKVSPERNRVSFYHFFNRD